MFNIYLYMFNIYYFEYKTLYPNKGWIDQNENANLLIGILPKFN